ncbi:MAG: class I adenylate-forming enzyme family protein [Gemmatimonadales bacterium]
MIDRVNLGDVTPDEAPDHPAIIDLRDPSAPATWTTATLDATADAVARGLVRRGHPLGARIAILAENRAEFLASYFGILRAGMVAVPINFKLPAETISFIFSDADVAAVLADRERIGLIPEGVPIIELDDPGQRGYRQFLDPGPWETVRPGPTDLAKILYTSGSTGRPKGVPLLHDGQLWALRKYFAGYQAGRRDATLVVAPTYHKNGLFFSTVAVSNQMTIVSLPRFEARRYLEAVATYHCTVLTGIPTMFALIARERDLLAKYDFGQVRQVMIGSAPLTDALLAQVQAIFPNAVIGNSYGTTEAGPCPFGPHPGGLARPPLSLGHPWHDVEWRLTGGSSSDEGIFELRSPALMPGYLNLDQVTAERVRDGWYATGDLMRRDADGFFYFVGRADDMFVCGGENIYPGEVEKLLERHPDVAQAAVVPVPDEIKGQIPVAFIVSTPGRTPAEDDIKRYTLEHGPAYAHPRAVIFADEIPVAGTHKVDRQHLIREATQLMRDRGRR